MPKAKLIKSRSLRTLGYMFLKNEEQSVSYDAAEVLKEDPRFKVTFDKGEHKPEAKDANGRPSSKAERLAAIQRAISDMGDDDANFTADGKPDARALTSALGWQVTAKERDEAMSNEAQVVENLGNETEPRKARPVMKPGESPETPKPENKGDISEDELKKQKSRTVAEILGKAPEKTEGEQEQPEQTGEQTGEEAGQGEETEQKPEGDQPEGDQPEGEKKSGGVTIKHKAADPTTDGAKDV